MVQLQKRQAVTDNYINLCMNFIILVCNRVFMHKTEQIFFVV